MRRCIFLRGICCHLTYRLPSGRGTTQQYSHASPSFMAQNYRIDLLKWKATLFGVSKPNLRTTTSQSSKSISKLMASIVLRRDLGIIRKVRRSVYNGITLAMDYCDGWWTANMRHVLQASAAAHIFTTWSSHSRYAGTKFAYMATFASLGSATHFIRSPVTSAARISSNVPM